MTNFNSSSSSDSSRSLLIRFEEFTTTYGGFVLAAFGIIGNFISILVFLSPRFGRQSSYFYLLALALSDLWFLIINLIENTFRNHNHLTHSGINILDRAPPSICKSVQYARSVTRFLSMWIIVAFSIERLFVVFYPLKRAEICRRKIARRVVATLFPISLLIYANIPFHFGITIYKENRHNETTCDLLPEYRSIYKRFAIVSMIMYFTLPMCIIAFVNILICFKLRQQNALTKNNHSKKTDEER
jgi:hypothetical protein